MNANAGSATNIVLKDTQEKNRSLDEFIGHGKWTVLNIWGPGCPPCIEEMPELVAFHDRHKKDNAIVVGIAIDFPSYGYADRQEVVDFMDDYLVDFTVLLSDSTITEKIGVGRLKGVPTTLLYTPDGKLVAMQVGGITAAVLENYISSYENRDASGQ